MPSGLARTLFTAVTTLGCTVGAANTANTFKAAFSSHLVPNTSRNANVQSNYGLSSANSTVDTPTDNAVLKVVTTVQAGNNQTFSQVLVDTGSAILWVGGLDPYEPGPDTVSINKTFSVGYGAGGVNGTAYNDTVTIGDAVVHSQLIGAAGYMTGFTLVSPIDGILGLGPPGSNAGEVSPYGTTATTPTFVENLVSQGVVDNATFGIYVNPLDESDGGEGEIGRGEIVFGGVDWGRISGSLTWVPQLEPYNFYWEFNVSSFHFGNTTLVSEPTPARTDTGVLSIGLPIDSILSIVSSTNASFVTANQSTTFEGFLLFPPAPSTTTTTGIGTGTGDDTNADLPPLVFGLGPSATDVFTIPPSQYLIPPALYASLNLTSDTSGGEGQGQGGVRYSWLSSAGFGAFSFGQKWLEGVYTAYDAEGHRVGFGHLV